MSPVRRRRAHVLIVFGSALLLAWFAHGPIAAQDRAPTADSRTSILIRDVTLIDADDPESDVVVQILIRNGKLAVVTEDPIAIDSVDLALDARGGVVIGKLDLGSEPSFLILDRDPREHFEALLDTDAHVTFAIRDGTVVRNRLILATEDADEPKRSGWIAYTPPPMSLPTTYLDTEKWNRWESRWVSGIFLSGLVLDRQNWVSQDDASLSQVGDVKTFDGGEIRGFRLGAVGTINLSRPWVYTVFAAANAFDKGFDVETTDSVTFFDWRIDIPMFGNVTLGIGKQKEPISMERITSLVYLPMQERSAVADALLPARNVGITLSGTAFDERSSWAAGVFNDWLDSGGSFGDGSGQLIGRLTGIPLASEGDFDLIHLGIGVRHSNTNGGFRVATTPEFNQAPLFVDTGDTRPADRSLTVDVEASWRSGPLWLAAEYVVNDVAAPASGDPTFRGHHVTASWALTREQRPYNRRSGVFGPLPVARSVYQGGWGAWEVAARWSVLDATDGDVDGGELDIASLGITWWLTPTFDVSLNYRWISLDRAGVTGRSSGINARVVLLLE